MDKKRTDSNNKPARASSRMQMNSKRAKICIALGIVGGIAIITIGLLFLYVLPALRADGQDGAAPKEEEFSQLEEASSDMGIACFDETLTFLRLAINSDSSTGLSVDDFDFDLAKQQIECFSNAIAEDKALLDGLQNSSALQDSAIAEKIQPSKVTWRQSLACSGRHGRSELATF